MRPRPRCSILSVVARASPRQIENSEIAAIFEMLADLLEIEGENPFRVRAYRNAARTIRDLPHSVRSLLAEGRDLAELPGVGRDLAGKIEEILATGRLAALDETKRRTPAALVELVALPALGPKRAKALHDELGIRTLGDLAAAVRAGRLRGLRGFGEKTEARILEDLARRRKAEPRMTLAAAERVAEPLLAYLGEAKGVRDRVIAGSYRRRKETVRDLDVLVTCAAGSDVMDRFVAYEEVEEVVAKGTTRSTVQLRSGLQVDLRVVPREGYGAALHYFTGSKAHNIAVRRRALARGLKLNEYGVFRADVRVAGRSEREVYEQVGLPYIEPELREDRGEIEAAEKGELPALVRLEHIRGDLHVHTRGADGTWALRETAEAARAKGYEYLAVADHAGRSPGGAGLDPRALGRQLEEIDRLNEELEGVVVLRSAEVEILENGTLDLPRAVLERLDLTVCAVHRGYDRRRDEQTERIIRAMDDPCFTVLAHPTGRILNERDPYRVDLERVMAAALERGCFVELNADPGRLDLDDVHCKLAKEMGLKVAVSTGARSAGELDFMRFGLGQARRGWLERADVLNTRRLRDLRKLLERGR